jgi:hypothetical protein
MVVIISTFESIVPIVPLRDNFPLLAFREFSGKFLSIICGSLIRNKLHYKDNKDILLEDFVRLPGL